MDLPQPLPCPRCHQPMAMAFAPASVTIPYQTPERILQFVHATGDVHHVPLWKRYLPHPAEYFLTHLCDACGVYSMEFKRSLTSADAKELARALVAGRQP